MRRRFQPKLPDNSLWPQGRFVYQRNCLVCHGAFGDGRGDGPGSQAAAPELRARHLQASQHPSGALPTDADLERTIRGGIAGTAMPVFVNLSDREIKSVIEYVKSLSFRWRNPTNYAPALVLPPLPAWFEDATLAKARKRGASFSTWRASSVTARTETGTEPRRRISKTPGASRRRHRICANRRRATAGRWRRFTGCC